MPGFMPVKIDGLGLRAEIGCEARPGPSSCLRQS